MPTSHFVLLPRRGLRAREGTAREILTSLPLVRSTAAPASATLPTAPGHEFRVLDTVSEDGPKLVELDEEGEALANAENSPLRALPLIVYPQPNPILSATAASGSSRTSFEVHVYDHTSRTSIPNVDVVAFDDFSLRSGDSGATDSNGRVSLSLSGTTIDRLYVYAPSGYWGAYFQNVTISVGSTVAAPIQPVDLTYTDAVRHFYGTSNFAHAAGVKVGVLDTGVGPHRDLNVVLGHNTVTGEPASDWQDPHGHGTHVAGLVGAQGSPPHGLRGMAPGAELYAFRVFGQNLKNGATNYAILKAMIFAAESECDIVNLSLGGGPWDDIVEEAVADARNNGMVVIAAAGNDGRAPVNYPAAHVGATAVSAMGQQNFFPTGSFDHSAVQRPPHGQDPNEFIAAFSNVGTNVDITAPGVGVLSTLPNNAYGPKSGTSMAAPVVAGAAACLLSQDPAIYGMPRNRARSDAIEKLLLAHCSRRGFGTMYEGYGMPDPAVV